MVVKRPGSGGMDEVNGTGSHDELHRPIAAAVGLHAHDFDIVAQLRGQWMRCGTAEVLVIHSEFWRVALGVPHTG
jgi:hypothetical protein